MKAISSVVIALSCVSCAPAFSPSVQSNAAPSQVVRAAPGHTFSAAELTRAAVVAQPAIPAAPSPVTRQAAALAIIERRIARMSHPDALLLAFQAYYSFRDAHPEQVRKPYLYFVDYGLDSREPRGYVFDMDRMEIVEGPFMVAHGRGSLSARAGVPVRFSNIQSSATTSLGLFLAEETYAFSGKSGGRHYRSIGLRLRGLSGSFNSAARRRGIVVHGAPYVTPEKAGRSEGCPAMEQSRAQRLIPMIANGGLVFHFSSRDAGWMRGDPWIARGNDRIAASNRAPWAE
jgi:hypothetical protein